MSMGLDIDRSKLVHLDELALDIEVGGYRKPY